MDWQEIQTFFTPESLLYWLNEYRDLGPLPGILIPLLESLLPFLPLFLFVAGNAAAYGFWLGSLYSWIGTVCGSLTVFLLIRKFARKRLKRFISRKPKVQSMLHWFERHGFGMIFLLLCFPFTPSSLINVVAGLSKVHIHTFTLSVIFGKMVMILIMSLIGHDIVSMIRQPVKMILASAAIFLLWLGGKYIETRLTKRRAADRA